MNAHNYGVHSSDSLINLLLHPTVAPNDFLYHYFSQIISLIATWCSISQVCSELFHWSCIFEHFFSRWWIGSIDGPDFLCFWTLNAENRPSDLSLMVYLEKGFGDQNTFWGDSYTLLSYYLPKRCTLLSHQYSIQVATLASSTAVIVVFKNKAKNK